MGADLLDVVDIVQRLSVVALIDRFVVHTLVVLDARNSTDQLFDLRVLRVDLSDLFDGLLGRGELTEREEVVELSGVRLQVAGV